MKIINSWVVIFNQPLVADNQLQCQPKEPENCIPVEKFNPEKADRQD